MEKHRLILVQAFLFAPQDSWVPKVEETSKSVKKVIGFFNNHYHGYAPENCLCMLEKLGLLSETQKKAKDKSKISNRSLVIFSAKVVSNNHRANSISQ